MALTESLANPYVAGSPLTRPEMFFGRDDVFRFINNALVGRHQDNIIVLYGKRRTGKTSVLYQMRRHIDQRYLPVLIDLQGLTMDSLAGFYWELAAVIRRSLRRDYGVDLKAPRSRREDFLEAPFQTFQTGFLTEALEALGDRHLLLMVDEVSRLQEQVESGKLPEEVFGQLRSLAQHSNRLNFIFAIGERLPALQTRYAMLFSVAIYKEISFLERSEAAELITRPTQNFYSLTPQAIDRIIEVTSGHPYFVQLLCHSLFAHWQRNPKPQLDLEDVNGTLNEVVERGSAVLKFEWDEARPVEKLLLAALAHMMANSSDTVTLAGVRQELNRLGIEALPGDLATAQRNLINTELISADRLRFTVDFMRLWVQEHEKLEWVREELAEPIAQLRQAAEQARAEAAARKKPARMGVLAAAALVAVFGVASLAVSLALTMDNKPRTSDGHAITNSVAYSGLCQPLVVQGTFELDWCIPSVDILDNNQVQLNVTWTLRILDEAQAGRGIIKEGIRLEDCQTALVRCVYLEYPDGTRIPMANLGGEASRSTAILDGASANGWFRFANVPVDDVCTFVFEEDNIRIPNVRLK